jgi:hypothetical protein
MKNLTAPRVVLNYKGMAKAIGDASATVEFSERTASTHLADRYRRALKSVGKGSASTRRFFPLGCCRLLQTVAHTRQRTKPVADSSQTVAFCCTQLELLHFMLAP